MQPPAILLEIYWYGEFPESWRCQALPFTVAVTGGPIGQAQSPIDYRL